MASTFTDRTMPILTQEGIDALARQTIAISALGGVGDREAVFAPSVTTVDFLEQRMETCDVTKD